MRQTIKLIIIVLTIPSILFAQNVSSTQNTEEAEETKKDGLSFVQYKQALVSFLSSTLTGQQNNSTGGFASFDIQDASATFSPNFIFEKSLVSAELTGRVLDGTTAIFNNNKLNTGISASLNYHFINYRGNDYFGQFIQFDGSNWHDYQTEKNKVTEKYEKLRASLKLDKSGNSGKLNEIKLKLNEQLELVSKYSSKIENLNRANKLKIQSLKDKKAFSERKKEEEKKAIKKLKQDKELTEILEKRSQISDYELKINEYTQNIKKLEEDNHELQNMKLQIEVSLVKIEELKEDLEKYSNKDLVNIERSALLSKRILELEELEKKYPLKISGISLNWFSVGYSVNNISFNYFDSTQLFDEQINNLDALSQEIVLQWTSYKYGEETRKEVKEDNKNKQPSDKKKWIPNHFWNNQIRFGFTNNFEELSSSKIRQSTLESSNGVNREIIEELNVFTGDTFEENLRHITLSSDFYYFIHKNKLAFHLAPEYRIRSKRKPISNLSAGVFFSFRNNDKEKKSPINVEAFYNLNDLFNTQESDLSITERNIIGLRFVFPINFQNFNN